MGTTLALKSEAQTTMVKAYVTYAASPALDGYENGGVDWVEKFDRAVAQ